MPTYEYECQTCGVHFERKQTVREDPMQTCPECGGKMRKLFFPAGIIFKGSGFYTTDYGSGANSPISSSSTKKDESAPSKAEPAKAETGKADSGKEGAAKSEPAKSEVTKTDK